MSEPREPRALRGEERSCEACGDAFVFGAGEQEFFADRGLAPPKRCPACRAARREGDPRRPSPPHEDARDAYPCDACGALTRLPFKPTGERPVYCERCFAFR